MNRHQVKATGNLAFEAASASACAQFFAHGSGVLRSTQWLRDAR